MHAMDSSHSHVVAFTSSVVLRPSDFFGNSRTAVARLCGHETLPARYISFRELYVRACVEQDKDRSVTNSKSTISRRGMLILINAGLGAATLGLLFKMQNQFRAISPAGVLASLGLEKVPSRVAAASMNDEPTALRQAALDFVAKADARQIPCPSLPRSADWINSPRLSFSKELKGKLVLLDFFTYCCINVRMNNFDPLMTLASSSRILKIFGFAFHAF